MKSRNKFKRKQLLFFVLFVVLIGTAFLSIIAIKVQKERPFYLDNDYYKTTSLTEIDNTKLKDLENSKKTFVVFVYQPLCSSSENINSYVLDILNTYKMGFYKISFSNIEDSKMDNKIKYCPSVVIYREGEIVAYLDADSDEDAIYYKSANNLKEWLEKYIILKN